MPIDCKRIGLFGKSKSGKSTMMNRLMRKHRRVILFDAIEERTESAKEEGFTRVTCINELQLLVNQNYEAGFRYWFMPHYEQDLIQALSDLSTFMLDIQTQYADEYGTENRPTLLLAVDEMADCFPNHIMKKGQDTFSVMCRSGRHKGIHLIGATQRPAEVSTKFRGQLEKRFFFSLQEGADLDAIEKIGGAKDGRKLSGAVRSLKPLEYIRMENGHYKSGKLTFP